jgi:hypothetical protein
MNAEHSSAEILAAFGNGGEYACLQVEMLPIPGRTIEANFTNRYCAAKLSKE